MAANLEALLKIRAQVDGANNIIQLNRNLKTVEGTTQGVTAAMRGMTGAAAGLSGALGALTPLLSVVGLVGLVKNSIEAGDALYDLSQRTGVSVEALARFKKAAATSGTDIDTVAKALSKLNRGMTEAAVTGKGAAAQALKSLGLSATDAGGRIKTADALTLEIADKFKKMSDGAVKGRLAFDLFGRAGDQLIPLLNMGGASIESLSVKMNEAFAKKADQYSDNLARLSGKVGALGADLVVALLPALEAITSAVTAGVDAFNKLPGPIKALAVGGAALAIAWGPITGIIAAAAAGFATLSAAFGSVIAYFAPIGLGIEGISVALTDLGFAIAAVPLAGWVIAGVAALAALGAALYANNEAFRSWVNNLGKVIASDFQNAMKQAAEITSAVTSFISEKWQWLVSAAQQVASGIGNAFSDKGPFGFIRRSAEWVFGGVQQAIAKLWNALPAPLRKALGQAGQMAVNIAASTPVGYAISAGIRASQMGPNTGTQSGSRNQPGGPQFTPDLSALDSGGAGKKAADEMKKAINDYNKAVEEGSKLTRGLMEKLQATNLNLMAIGANAVDALGVQRLRDENTLMKEYADNMRTVADLEKKRAAAQAKGLATTTLDAEIQAATEQAAKLRDQMRFEAQEKYTQGLVDLLPKEEQYTKQIETNKIALDNRKKGITEMTEAQKLDLEVQLLGLDVLAQTYPALEANIKKLRERAKALDDSKKALTDKSFGESFKESFRSYIESVKDLGSALGNVAVKAVQGLEDKLFEFITTGKLKFKEFISDVLKDLARLALRLAIVNTIKAVFPGLKFANGGIMTATGAVPLKRYATGGIATSPQLAMFGEGSTPEAYVPLPDGRRIPVAMKGGGGGTNVVVNVDAKGTSVQGDNTQGAALGRVISAAVQNELIKQRRPGGLLAA